MAFLDTTARKNFRDYIKMKSTQYYKLVFQGLRGILRKPILTLNFISYMTQLSLWRIAMRLHWHSMAIMLLERFLRKRSDAERRPFHFLYDELAKSYDHQGDQTNSDKCRQLGKQFKSEFMTKGFINKKPNDSA